MALVKCKECGEKISKSAKSCPRCGAKKAGSPIVKWGCASIFAFFVFVMIIPFSYDGSNQANETETTKQGVALKPQISKEKAEKEINKEIKPRLSLWDKDEWKSDVDDSPAYLLSVASLTDNRFGTNFIGKPATLYIRCLENKTSLYIDYNGFINNDSVRVTTRVDKNKAKTGAWGVLTSYKGAWKNNPVPFIKSLFGGNELLVQLTPYGEDTQTRKFIIANIENEIKPLRKACNW